MYEYWWNRLILCPNGPRQDSLASWNRQDLTDFDPPVYFGNIDGNFTGSVSMSIESFRGIKNLIRLDFTNFFGGAFIGFTGSFQQTRYVHYIELASGSAAQNETYFFVSPFFDTTSKNGLIFASRFTTNDLNAFYIISNSSSLKQDYSNTWLDIETTHFKNYKLYTNYKPSGSHLHYRNRMFKYDQSTSYSMTSLSHSAPVQWSGSTFNKNGFGFLVTGSVQRSGYILISEFDLIKHPYDIDS